jgi:acyl transferase domain-containing protein/predicted O-methyltransferase YrrM
MGQWLIISDELSQSQETSRVGIASIGQPLCTAIQIALVDLLTSWNVHPTAVIGHSSGEIAAAYACGSLTTSEALQVSYHRGHLAGTIKTRAPGNNGAMLAVGLSVQETEDYISKIEMSLGKIGIACVNSPSSVTVSGDESAILALEEVLTASQIFARKLLVDTAYHSHHMEIIADDYLRALEPIRPRKAVDSICFFSSVTGMRMTGQELDGSYWVKNMVSPVRFSRAVEGLCIPKQTATDGVSIDTLLEIGPHSALAGPISQIFASSTLKDGGIKYLSCLSRNKDATTTTLQVAGELFAAGFPIDVNAINTENGKRHTIVDLPSYPWDHTSRHWHETRFSSAYRSRVNPRHHLLGVPSPDFNLLEPTWRNYIRVTENPWVRGHIVQSNIVYPAAGYIAMAVQACLETHLSKKTKDTLLSYSFRNISFGKALLVPDHSEGVEVNFTLRPYTTTARSSSDTWDEFRIFSYTERDGWSEHCRGLVTLKYREELDEVEADREAEYTKSATNKRFASASTSCRTSLETSHLYRTFAEFGLDYRTPFTNITSITAEPHQSKAIVNIPDTAVLMPAGFELPQVIHPATLDSCFQTLFPALMRAGLLEDTMVPTFLEQLTISSNISSTPGDQLLVHTSTVASGLRGCKADIIVKPSSTVDSATDTVITISGLSCTTLEGGTASGQMMGKSSREMCYRMQWLPDVTLLTTPDIKRLCTKDLLEASAADRLQSWQSMTIYYVRKCLEKLSDEDSQSMEIHNKHLYSWMKRFAAISAPTSSETEISLTKKAQSYGAAGVALCRIGPKLPEIMKSQIEPLALLMEDNLLYDVYADDGSLRCYVQMAEYVNMLANKNPDMNILEIGAGTGGSTIPLLRTLGSHEGSQRPRFGHYDFTDISAGFFEKAEQLLEQWEGLVSFRKLDVEKDTDGQGFEDGSYDLIIASNVLHATRDMNITMTNVRKLLKPGGKLLLMEITRPKSYLNIVFGVLSGWWLGK